MSSHTIGSFISDTRSILRDTSSSSYHYSDLMVMSGAVDALRTLYAMRPESRYVDMALTDVTFPTDEAELKVFSVSIEDKWRLGVVYFAASRCFETDVTDTVNLQLAQTYMQKAIAEFQK